MTSPVSSRTADGVIKVGLMSFAHMHAASYARILSSTPGIEVRASDPGQAERPDESGGPELAAELGVDYADSYDELLAWRPDAVVICSENARHRTDTEQAIAAGARAVLCEKPVATSLADADAMITAADAAGAMLMIAYPVRYSPTFVALKQAHDAGRLGTLRGLHGTNNGRVPSGGRAWFVDPVLAGGGALIDHIVHLADLYDELLGHQPAENVYAVANSLMPGAPVGVETTGLVSVRYPGGLVASIDSSWSMPLHGPTWGGLTMDAIGDAGMASMDAFLTRVDGYSETEQRPLWLGYGANLDTIMVETFLRCVRTGEAPPVDGRGGRRSLAVALAALESVRTGVAVDVVA